MLRIENVSKSYGDKIALKNVSFNIPEASTFGLLGPNGAGKSTLIRIINKILVEDHGEIFINGEKLSAKHISQIGYMPEERGLYKKMKVGEHVVYLARLKGLSKADAVARTKVWFERMEMTDWWNKKVESLSKGMQQKVQFISTVIHNPKLIILDEPFSGFDPVNAEQVKNELLRLRDEGATIMLSTHRMESVEELCDNIGMIHKSEKVIEGKISEVKRAYSKNLFEIVYKGEKLETDDSLLKHEERENGEWLMQSATTDANAWLQNTLAKTQVVSYREVLPTVQEIFVEIAKG
ncbi:MAG: ATP-binding cassette domain-containing protein [Bacteroidetes bacterium]|nr:ATP-binding cassette domain-containing protein [Bacteroidota bacterium]